MRACSSGVSFGIEALGLERGVAERLRAERVEARREVAVHAERLDERHRGGDAAEQLAVDRLPAQAPRPARARAAPAVRPCRVPVAAVAAAARAAARGPAALRRAVSGRALEQVAPLRRDGVGVVEVLLEEQRGVARCSGRRRRDGPFHVRCSSAAPLPERPLGDDRDRHPEEEADGGR